MFPLVLLPSLLSVLIYILTVGGVLNLAAYCMTGAEWQKVQVISVCLAVCLWAWTFHFVSMNSTTQVEPTKFQINHLYYGFLFFFSLSFWVNSLDLTSSLQSRDGKTSVYIGEKIRLSGTQSGSKSGLSTIRQRLDHLRWRAKTRLWKAAVHLTHARSVIKTHWLTGYIKKNLSHNTLQSSARQKMKQQPRCYIC